MAFALVQRPGKIVPDTKVALALDPARFLGAALHLWNPDVALGSIGNQQVGYLFPMGPFFLLTHALGIPVAFAQRLWLGALLVLAFWGAVRLADALVIGNRAGRILGGLAYALSPFVLLRAGDLSALLLGAALLPWALTPLVRVTAAPHEPGGRATASVRRAAAQSGIAVLFMGGANAAITACALVGPLLWLILMCRGRRAWALRAWWLLALVCATAWWAVALALQGQYGIDFLRYTESASTTTSVTSLPETLRGSADWLAYFHLAGSSPQPSLTLLGAGVAMVASFVVVGLGLAGLARRDIPARRFLLASLCLGTIAVGAAYAGQPQGVLSGQWREVLTGPFAAFRNVNKFQPLIRLPLALGLAACLPLVTARWRAWATRRRAARITINATAAAVMGAAVLLTAAPLGLSRVYPEHGFTSVPGYWSQAADWLTSNATDGSTLLLPASGSGDYRWGDPEDEPMLWLSRTPWAVRDLIPIGGVNSTRLLDAIERQLGQRAAPDLAPVLARAGVGFVLVRNDLAPEPGGGRPSPAAIEQAMSDSQLRQVATFGPVVAGTGRPALAIYAVGGVHRVDSYPADRLTLVSGGPEALVTLGESGVLGNRPTVLAMDAAGRVGANGKLLGGLRFAEWIDTDTLQRRAESFGVLHGTPSYLLTPEGREAGQTAAPRLRLDVAAGGHETTLGLTGISSVTASGYGTPLGGVSSDGPNAAVDANVDTAWSTSGFPGGSVGQWLQVGFPEPRSVDAVSVRLLADTPARPVITRLRVTTDTGSLVTSLRDTNAAQTVPVPAGPTRSLRLTIDGLSKAGTLFLGPGIRELTVSGVSIQQTTLLPDDAAGLVRPDAAASYVFARYRTDPNAAFQEEPQLKRTFTVRADADFFASGTAVADPTTLQLPAGGTDVALACGSGPDVLIDGRHYQTYARGSRAAFEGGQPVALGLCTVRPITLRAGMHTVQSIPSRASNRVPPLSIATLALQTRADLTAAEETRTATPTHWGPEHRTVTLPAGKATILTIHENFNRSWHASVNGKALAAVRVDGWQQGFVVPAGPAVTITITNTPGVLLRWALAASALLALLLLVAALWPGRAGRPPVARVSTAGPVVSRLAALTVAAVTMVLLVGPWAALVPGLAVLVWSARRLAGLIALAALCTAAGFVYAEPARLAFSHQGAFAPVTQLLAALALTVVVLAGVNGSLRPRRSRAGEAPDGAGRPDESRSESSGGVVNQPV